MIVGWALGGLQTVLAVAMAAAAGMKLAEHDRVVEEFDRYGYSRSFMTLTGAIEGLAALGLLAGLLRPTVAVAGGAVTLAVMVGALYTHARVGDPVSEAAAAIVLFVLATVVTGGVAASAGVVPI